MAAAYKWSIDAPEKSTYEGLVHPNLEISPRKAMTPNNASGPTGSLGSTGSPLSGAARRTKSRAIHDFHGLSVDKNQDVTDGESNANVITNEVVAKLEPSTVTGAAASDLPDHESPIMENPPRKLRLQKILIKCRQLWKATTGMK